MNANSSGSVTPVRKAVSAAESMMPPVTFLAAGLASCQMAIAAAGRANIMIGKKPVMKAPAVLSPARKRAMSPCTTLPEAAV